MRYSRFAHLLLASCSLLHGLSLKETVSQALEQSPEWAAQTYLYQAQSLAPGATLGPMLPSVSTSFQQTGGISYGDASVAPTTAFNQTWVNMNVTVPLYQPQSLAAYDSACDQAEIDELNYQARQEAFIMQVVESYFQVLLQAKNVTLSERFLASRQKLYDDTQEKFHVGLVALSDLKGAEAYRDQALAQKIQAQFGLTSAQQQLENILHFTPAELNDTSLEMLLSYPDHFSPQKPHYSLEIAQKQIHKAANSLRSSQASLYPSLSCSTSYAHQPFNTNGSQSTSQISSSVVLSWSPFQGGAMLTEVQQAKYQQQAAKSTQLQTNKDYATRCYILQQQLKTSIARLVAQREGLASAKIYLATVESSYEAGQTTITDVLDAQRNVTDEEKRVFEQIYSCLREYLELGLLMSYPYEKLLSDMDVFLQNPWEWANA